MTKRTGRLLQRSRILVQVLCVVFFIVLLANMGKWPRKWAFLGDIFFYLDPLLSLVFVILTHTLIPLFLISLIPALLTLVFGRFFCGWICPMGAVQQFFTWLFKARKKPEKKIVQPRLLRIKYLVLALVLVSALFGTQLAGWLDPFSLLTRSVTTVIAPASGYLVHDTLKKGAEDQGILAKTLRPLYRLGQKTVLPVKPRAYDQTIFIGLIFLAIILLNLYHRRFFCNVLCPLGALYGLLSRFSLFNLHPTAECKSCNLCAKNCTYQGSPYQDYLKSECLTCFNCVPDCPSQALEVQWRLPGKTTVSGVNASRRAWLTTAASGLLVAALPRINTFNSSKIRRFCRPPGSVGEKEFLEKCVRCGACMQACPTNFIQPSLFQAGIDGLWTPTLNPRNGYCEYECDKCTKVCPTRAIAPIGLKEKKQFKIGTAVVDKNRCYTYADGYNCAVCEEHCPIPEKAIRFREVDTWNLYGRLVKVRQIYVKPDLCTGCGICENVCPRLDSPGIILTAEEEQREAKY